VSIQVTRTTTSVAALEEFYRDAHQPLVRHAIFVGWDPDDAEDAVSDTMLDVVKRWDLIENPQAYARRAVISNLIKNKERGLRRIRERLIQLGAVPPEHDLDPGLMVWEQQEWVTRLLKSLPPAEREALAFVVDGFTPQEIALLLGKTDAAVRQNLHAARKRLTKYLAETGEPEPPPQHPGGGPDERQRPCT
jgi:RNA polymerase sigma-70 factor (ECF subfamily)